MRADGGNIIGFEHATAGNRAVMDGPKATRQVAAHQHLYFEGDPRTNLFVIETGWVKLYRTLIDGQRQVVGFCNGGSVLGLEGGEEYANGCEAITPVTLRSIPVSHLPEVFRRDPTLAGQLKAAPTWLPPYLTASPIPTNSCWSALVQQSPGRSVRL